MRFLLHSLPFYISFVISVVTSFEDATSSNEHNDEDEEMVDLTQQVCGYCML